MFYPFECEQCNVCDDYEFGMNDDKHVDCPECGKPMQRIFCSPFITGDLNYEYDDPQLGYVKSRQDRADKMKAAGLTEYVEPDATKGITEERKYIRGHSDFGQDKGALAEHEALGRKKGEIRRQEIAKAEIRSKSAGIQSAIKKAVEQTGVNVS